MKLWRCNLTALSHAYNLYFVACNTDIHVYEPCFPNQRLARKPDLVLKTPLRTIPYDVPMGIDYMDPHSITRLHIEFLGNLEIVLVTCDDGDVIGYNVPHIYNSIERVRAERKGMVNEPVPPPLPFLHFNVGASAWGLAVHQAARLIAVSSNTHQIRVVVYGLSEKKPDSQSEFEKSGGDEISDDGPDVVHQYPFTRKKDYFITLEVSQGQNICILTCVPKLLLKLIFFSKGQTNIPYITFDNTGADPDGRWLFSSSIDGATHVWDLSNPGAPVRTIRVGYCVSTRRMSEAPAICQCRNRTSVPHAAWASVLVDPRHCHQVSSLEEIGGPGFISSMGEQRFWDITDALPFGFKTALVPEPQPLFSSTEDVMAFIDDESELDSVSNEEEEMEETIPWSSDSEQGTPLQTGQQQQQLQELESPIPPVTPQYQLQSQDEESSLFVPEASTHSSVILPTNHLQIDSDTDTDTSQGTSEDLSPSPTYATFLPTSPPRAHPQPPPKNPYCAIHPLHLTLHTSYPRSPRTPFLVITKEEIYLFQHHPLQDSPSSPILVLRNPLFAPSPSPTTNPSHRHCFSLYISPLSILLVASPAGRIGVVRLTRYTDRSSGNEVFGMRIEHVLPSKEQPEGGGVEYAVQRRLVGIAAGPLQGKGGRWRVMAYWSDHRIGCWVLGGEEGVGGLVV